MMSGVDYGPDAESAGRDTRYEQHSAGSHRPGSVTRTAAAKEGAKDGAKQVCKQPIQHSSRSGAGRMF